MSSPDIDNDILSPPDTDMWTLFFTVYLYLTPGPHQILISYIWPLLFTVYWYMTPCPYQILISDLFSHYMLISGTSSSTDTDIWPLHYIIYTDIWHLVLSRYLYLTSSLDYIMISGTLSSPDTDIGPLLFTLYWYLTPCPHQILISNLLSSLYIDIWHLVLTRYWYLTSSFHYILISDTLSWYLSSPGCPCLCLTSDVVNDDEVRWESRRGESFVLSDLRTVRTVPAAQGHQNKMQICLITNDHIMMYWCTHVAL